MAGADRQVLRAHVRWRRSGLGGAVPPNQPSHLTRVPRYLICTHNQKRGGDADDTWENVCASVIAHGDARQSLSQPNDELDEVSLLEATTVGNQLGGPQTGMSTRPRYARARGTRRCQDAIDDQDDGTNRHHAWFGDER